MRRLAIVMALGFAGATGCGAPDADGAVGSEDEATTSGYLYQCHRLHDATEVAEIFVGKTVATLTSSDAAISGVAADYTYQPKYKPRSAKHKGQAKYTWAPTYKNGQPGYTMSLLVDGAMR